MKTLALALCAALWAGAWPARAGAASEYGTETVGRAASDLLQETRDPGAALYQIHSDAQRFADGVADIHTTLDVRGVYRYISWLPKEFLGDADYTRRGTVEAIEDMLRFVLLGAEENPDRRELVKAYWVASELRSNHQVAWDGDDGRAVLGRNVAGAYTYTPGVDERDDRAVGIYFNKDFKRAVCEEIGDRPCAAILAHEACHAKDRREGNLNPNTVQANELRAFRCEFNYLRWAYRDLREFNWLKYDVLDRPKAAPRARQYSEDAARFIRHLAEVLTTGGDESALLELVKKLGYADPHSWTVSRRDPERI